MSYYRTYLILILLSIFSIVGCKHQQLTIEKTTDTPLPTNTSLLKVIFDDSRSQLIGIEPSGKVLDSAVIAFQLSARIQGVAYSETTTGCFLSKAMLDLLKKTDVNSIVYFEHIQAKNAAGMIGEASNFQFNIGYSYKPKK